ncbi:PAS domain S-box-containing protein [Methylobacter tundripaludum]|uniref:PAS domain S-box-containing protein n=1 Tax=Methylobacter tundripaludum TaxID=173365 RepID=A0A2S6HHQ9_9GAMM|nr:sigma 54-interacting transcriptional regulator [Methylobacter tundripaludum]PPK76911.1 PAS domain S-box-containing protein [Methylobacter tundripaludum]
MKQTKQLSELLSGWLTQQPLQPLFLKLLDLCDVAALYIVDRDQQVIHWSRGAEQLSGLNAEDVTGKPCLQEYVITEGGDHQKQLIKLVQADGHEIELNKMTHVLHDHEGVFAGGLGLLLPASEQSENAPLPKDSSAMPDSRKQGFQGLLSRSPAMQAVFQIIQNAAETEATVLVRGESGSGKELVAKAIHDLSVRRNAPFLAINCAALSSSLLDSELFGHVRGAFTGAIKDHSGLFQRAHGGTLFLDEVAELPLELQAKLLRVIQERNYIPVGGDRSIDVDVRIVAATHRSLREEVKMGRFRDDLMYRLRVVPIFIPPLRERREDISLLIWHFIQQHNAANFRKIEKIDPQAMRALLDYAWPGNIRELHNVVEYAFAVGRGTTLRCSELPPEFRESRTALPQAMQNTPLSADEESAAIRQALEQSNGRVTQAARSLGMSRATFWRKRKIYGV